MHDETFLITSGRLRFTIIPTSTLPSSSPSISTSTSPTNHSSQTQNIDTQTGDYVVVPPKSIHTFSNPFDEPASFFNTFTPAYYVDYLRMLAGAIAEAQKGGKKLTEEEQRAVMAQFATFEP